MAGSLKNRSVDASYVTGVFYIGEPVSSRASLMIASPIQEMAVFEVSSAAVDVSAWPSL